MHSVRHHHPLVQSTNIGRRHIVRSTAYWRNLKYIMASDRAWLVTVAFTNVMDSRSHSEILLNNSPAMGLI